MIKCHWILNTTGLTYFILTINILTLFSKEGIFNINANCILRLTIYIEFMLILNLNLQASVCEFFLLYSPGMDERKA